MFEVIERFKGVDATQIDVQTGIGGGDCGWSFVKGSTYLVYAYREQSSGQLQTGICMRTNLVDRAGEDLAQLRSIASRGPEGRVFGYVTTRRPNRWEPYTGDGALAGTPVWLRSDAGKVKAVTDSRGEYSFDGLRPGKYAI